MEKKEREELIKRLDMMDGFPEWKVPCQSCQKGGMNMDMNGNEYTCDKCGGSEWVVNPELVKVFEQELDKAREEGYEQGYKECKKDFAVGVGMHNDPEFSEIVSKVAEKLSKLKTVSNMEEKIECDIKEKTYYLTEEEFEIVKQMLGDPTEELSDCCGAEVDEHGADDHTSRCLGCGEFCGIVYIWD